MAAGRGIKVSQQQFDGLQDSYRRYRPSYPSQLVRELVDRVSKEQSGATTIVDVGSGTGIFTRQLHESFGPDYRCVGVEPGLAMREQAQAEGPPSIAYLDASAEDIPLAAASAALVSAAQALHWFDRPRFYKEASRLLAQGGVLAVIYTHYDRVEPAMKDINDFLDEWAPLPDNSPPGALAAHAGQGLRFLRDGTFQTELAALETFSSVATSEVSWVRTMTPDDLVGKCLSTVRMLRVIDALGKAEATTRLRHIAIATCGLAGSALVPHRTTMLTTRRRANA